MGRNTDTIARREKVEYITVTVDRMVDVVLGVSQYLYCVSEIVTS